MISRRTTIVNTTVVTLIADLIGNAQLVLGGGRVHLD